MSVVPDSAGVGTVTRASPGVSFDVFDSNTAESPESSVSAGGVGHEGFGTPLLPVAAGKVATAGLKDALGGAALHGVRSGEASGGTGGHDMISAYRDVASAKTGRIGKTTVGSDQAPSAVDRAKARLESWRSMADRLEHVMVEDQRARSAGALRRTHPGAFKTIGQLRKEIVAIKAETSARAAVGRRHAMRGDEPESQAPSGLGKAHVQQLALLESKLVRAEGKIQKRDDAINQLKSSVSQLQASLVAKQEQLQLAKQEAQSSARAAAESRDDFARLKSNSDRSLTRIKGLQGEISSLQMQLEDAGVNLKKAEQLTAQEKSRRLELEQRLVDTDDAISRLKTKVESSKRRMHANHETLDTENRNMRSEVQGLREALVEAKRLATEHAEAAIEVSQQRDAAERKCAGRTLEVKDLRAELHIAKQKARVAEEAAAEAAAELYVLKATEKQGVADFESASELRIEFEATKKVLNSVTASAKVSKAEVLTLQEELRKARVEHEEQMEKVNGCHVQALAEERKYHMEALQEIEASHAAQIRQDVDRVEQARVALARQIDEMAHDMQLKDDAIQGLQKMLKDREAVMDEMTRGMDSMKLELMQTQDEVEALLTARLKAELGRADGGSANVLGVEGGEVPDQKPRSPIKRFIAKLSPKKKTRAERDGALMGAH